MLYITVVLCAFLAATTEGRNRQSLLRTDNPVTWLLAFGSVYWCLSLGNGFDWLGYFQESECLRLGYCEEAYTSFEPLFAQLLELSAVTDYQVVPFAAGLASCTAIVTMARSSHFNNYSILFFISICAFYLYIEQVRQGMAMCFLIMATNSFMNNRKVIFAIQCILASLFHWSTLLFVVPFLLARAGKATGAIVTAVTMSVFATALLAPEAIFDFLNTMGLGEIDVAKKIFFYAVVEDYNATAIGLGFVFDLMLMILLLAPMRNIKNSRLNLGLVTIIYFSILLLSRINTSVYRVTLVFVPFVCLFFSDFFNQQRAGVVIAGTRINANLYGFIMALVMLAQSSRPLLDPILQSNMFEHKIYLLDGTPSREQRTEVSERKCDFLDQGGKGFLCGRW